MEGLTEALNMINLYEMENSNRNNLSEMENSDMNNLSEMENSNCIHVSEPRASLLFYCNLAKRYLRIYDEVEIFATGPSDGLFVKGESITTVVTIAEILKYTGFAVQKNLRSVSIDIVRQPEGGAATIATVTVVLVKSEKFDELWRAELEQRVTIGEN